MDILANPNLLRNKPIQKFTAYYFSGIAVVARHFDIEVTELSIGDDAGLGGYAFLQPVSTWCSMGVEENPFAASAMEDYITTLLAGSAATFLKTMDERCQVKRSFGDAGLEMQFLREIWQGLQREPDRAISLIFGSLGHVDEGDIEATARRLWHRAIRILRQPKVNTKLQRLVRRIEDVRKMSGAQIDACTRGH